MKDLNRFIAEFAQNDLVLQVENLSTLFWTPNGVVEAVKHVSLSLKKGEIYGLVGESGSGKSALARSILGVPGGLPGIVSGTIRIKNGADLWHEAIFDISRYWGYDEVAKYTTGNLRKAKGIKHLIDRGYRGIRGVDVGLILQNTRGSLNPYFTVREQVMHNLRRNWKNRTKRDVDDQVDYWLDRVEMAHLGDCYPHHISGGEAQRAATAVTMVTEPKVLIADEPTTGLDACLRKEIVDLLCDVTDDGKRSLILITHDMGIIKYACDRMGVMHKGKLIEESDTDTAQSLSHDASRELLTCLEQRLEKRSRTFLHR